MKDPVSRPLFETFPGLREPLPFVALASLPTPLQRMETLSAEVGADLWVKRDGLTHLVYGGNKIRKFEFVFGDLLRKGARVVMTGGGLGSHHTLATAVMARQFGLQAICCYYCQPIDEEVLRNLRLSAALDIEAHFCGDYVGLALSFLRQWLRGLARTGPPPYFIYPGAPGTLGVLGYVNAAFELRAQLEAMAEPEPEDIFVAVGSCGTMAGLMLGARLAGLNSRIVGVRIIEQDVANRTKIARMVTRAARYLRRCDPSVPAVRVEPDEVELLDGYLGDGYAHATDEARRAVALVAETENLPLETTYTGKAMAALLETARRQPGARLLFVDTFAEAPALQPADYRALPKAFWPIFDPDHPGQCWCLRAWRDPDYCWKQCRDRR
jgi:1-aminocyclopropane-1-carboxylate deaminase/D-cysteine desulfhydrase-like pyridoxal-dependent ACC family enzyme